MTRGSTKFAASFRPGGELDAVTQVADGWEYEKRLREFQALTLLEMEACRRNPVYWLEHYAWSQDEHLRINNERPLIHAKPYIDRQTLLPMRELGLCTHEAPLECHDCGIDDYLLYIAALWWNEDRLAVPKSRQLRLTHLMVNLHGWLAMMFPGQRIALQSKKFEDANETLKRLDNSFGIMAKMHTNMPWPGHVFKEGRMLFPNGSVIMAVAQGAAVVRQYTFSAIFSDETAFQVEADEAYTAALPTVLGGGKYTMVSSANPGFFQDMCYDKSGKMV